MTDTKPLSFASNTDMVHSWLYLASTGRLSSDEVFCMSSKIGSLLDQRDALLDAVNAWKRFDSESGDINPSPDIYMRRAYRQAARDISVAAIGLCESNPVA